MLVAPDFDLRAQRGGSRAANSSGSDFFPAWENERKLLRLAPVRRLPVSLAYDNPYKRSTAWAFTLDKNHKPFAEIEATDDWSVTRVMSCSNVGRSVWPQILGGP